MICRILVNRHKVAQNKRDKTDEPCLSLKTSKGAEYAREVELTGTWRLKQNFEKPMCSGATVYLEGRREDVRIVR